MNITNIGILQQRPFLVNSKLVNGLRFDGMSHYINIPTTTSLNLGTGDFTLSVFFRLNTLASSQRLISKQFNAGSNTGYAIQYNASLGLLLTPYSSSDDVTTPIPYMGVGMVKQNTIHHFCVTKSGTNVSGVKFYLDGLVRNWTNLNPSYTTIGNLDNSADLTLGNLNVSGIQYLNGYEFDTKIIKGTALSAGEVKNLYLSGGVYTHANMVLDSRLDETNGTSASDSSGNSNTGTLVNYTSGQTTLGSGNYHVDYNTNPLT